MYVNMLAQEEKTIETTEVKKKPRSSNKKRSGANKPEGFNEFEALAKEILTGQGISYFDWLHKKHQEVVLNFNLSNKDEIAMLAKE
ncbi:hypothetical protein Bbad01_32010 [Bacillus badius]|nr:hypothetical protein Bbad01_32010 [Bacillus badius]